MPEPQEMELEHFCWLGSFSVDCVTRAVTTCVLFIALSQASKHSTWQLVAALSGRAG